MPVIEQILSGMNKGREDFERITREMGYPENMEAKPADAGELSELCRGDNLEYMSRLLKSGYAGKFSLIYIDPPFFTRSSFNASVTLKDAEGKKHQIHHLAYDDKFDRNLEYYIENMTVRLLMMKELLSDTGLMWVHLDWHSSHYIKLVMDELMGEKNFINEIIWHYKSGGSGKRHFARKHDSILVYSKTPDYYIDIPQEKSYNRGFKAYNFKGVEEYQDELGWYTLVNMKDVWGIDMVGRTSAERTGYATQKPIELMKRIVASCTKEGELAGDFFCGSGSLLEAAQLMGRSWIGCDSEEIAVSMARSRMIKTGAKFNYVQLDESEPLYGKASVEVINRQSTEDGLYLYKCKLTDLVPEIDIGSIQMSDRKYIDEALKADRLQFADHIMLDVKGGGKFECDYVFSEDLDDMIFVAEDNFKVVVVDVFGKEYAADLDIPSAHN